MPSVPSSSPGLCGCGGGDDRGRVHTYTKEGIEQKLPLQRHSNDAMHLVEDAMHLVERYPNYTSFQAEQYSMQEVPSSILPLPNCRFI